MIKETAVPGAASHPLPLALLCLAMPGAPAADWPQWRGPLRTGVSAEKGWRETWPAQGPATASSATPKPAGS